MEPVYPGTELPMSENTESQYIRNHQYTQRVPSSHYPDVHYNGYNQPDVQPVGVSSHRYKEGEFASTDFFQRVDPQMFALPQTEIEWSYNLRRAAQRILPFLYLGPWSFLSNKQWLNDEGITLLLGVRDQRLAHSRLFSGQKAAKDAGIESDSFDIVNGQDLISRLPQTIRRINDHICPSVTPDGGVPLPRKVLVFCETGNGLSALVVVAYCMVMLNMPLGQTLNFIHSQRFCIDMEDGFKPLLVAFEGLLEAKRDVENANRAAGATSNLAPPMMTLSKKRSFADQQEDEKMDDDNMEVEASSLDRKPQAPFQDRWG